MPYLFRYDSTLSFGSLEIHGNRTIAGKFASANVRVGRLKLLSEQQTFPVTVESVQSVRTMRLQRPSKCPNSTRRILSTSPSEHNWAPYYFRCNDLLLQRDPPYYFRCNDLLLQR